MKVVNIPAERKYIDSKTVTIEFTGRELAAIYAGLMNLSSSEANRTIRVDLGDVLETQFNSADEFVYSEVLDVLRNLSH